MALKRTAKTGDYKRAQRSLEKAGGHVEGSPGAILKKLGFDGSWEEFRTDFGVPVVKTDLGRYAVTSCQNTDMESLQVPQESYTAVDPDSYARCASNFLIGVGDAEDLEAYKAPYDEIETMTAALAIHIDDSLAGLYLPYKTDEDMEVYTVERSLWYSAAGDDTFTIYGSSILAQV